MNVRFFDVEDGPEKPLVVKDDYQARENERLKEQMQALVMLVLVLFLILLACRMPDEEVEKLKQLEN